MSVIDDMTSGSCGLQRKLENQHKFILSSINRFVKLNSQDFKMILFFFGVHDLPI